MVKQVKLYVEGGGNGKYDQINCRKGFRRLLESSGFTGHMPRIHAGGGRNATFDAFQTAQRSAAPNDYPIMLVDSEDPLPTKGISAWAHLKTRDQWERPANTDEDQA